MFWPLYWWGLPLVLQMPLAFLVLFTSSWCYMLSLFWLSLWLVISSSGMLLSWRWFTMARCMVLCGKWLPEGLFPFFCHYGDLCCLQLKWPLLMWKYFLFWKAGQKYPSIINFYILRTSWYLGIACDINYKWSSWTDLVISSDYNSVVMFWSLVSWFTSFVCSHHDLCVNWGGLPFCSYLYFDSLATIAILPVIFLLWKCCTYKYVGEICFL